MTMRADMANSCKREKKGIHQVCGGKVPVVEAHWVEAKEQMGDDKEAQANYLLSQAQQGCSQFCACLHSSAPRFQDIDGVQHIVASCNPNPNALTLGDVVES